MSEKDIDVLARTIWAEARGEGRAGPGRLLWGGVSGSTSRAGADDLSRE